MTDEQGFRPLLAFDTDDPQFARGFEAGRLWTILASLEESEWVATIGIGNAEMALRIAEALGFSVVSTELDGEWMDVCFCDSKAGS